MATSTTNYNFKKPDESDFYDISDQNKNWDLADEALKNLDTPTFEDYTGSTAVPSATDAINQIKSKGKLGALLANIKAAFKGACLIGHIVNNCVTDNAKLPLSAAQGKVLKDLYTQLYSDATGKRLGENYIMNYSDFSDPLVSQYQISSLASDPYGNAPASNVGDFRILRLGNSIEKFNTLILTSPRFKSTSSMSQEFYIGNFWDGVWMGWESLASKSALDNLTALYTATRSNYEKGNIFQEPIESFSSPAQLKHAGFYKFNSMTADVNNDAGSEAMTDYNTGDFYGLLLGTDINTTDGCNYGTLIVTSPRINDGIWICTIWKKKIIHWHKVKGA